MSTNLMTTEELLRILEGDFDDEDFSETKSLDDLDLEVYSVEDYDSTYTITKSVLSWVTIRLTHHITKSTTKCWDLFYWFEFLNVALSTCSEFIAMTLTVSGAESFRDTIKVFGMMPCFGCCVLAMLKSIKMVWNRPVFENLVNELRAMWPNGEVAQDEHQILNAAKKELNFIVKGYYWCNIALLISFLCPPFVITLWRYLGHDAPMLLHFVYWLPFDPFKPIVYEIMLVTQTWQACVVIFWNVAWDMLFCTFLCHITTQFDLLARRIHRLFYVAIDHQLVRTYPLAVVSEDFIRTEKELLNSYSEVDWEIRHQREISSIVQRHQALIRLAGDVEKMFSFALLINFMNSSIIICFCGFCCVLVEKWNEVAYKSFLVTALSQTALLCWYGQKLLDSSKGVAEALYSCSWYNVSKKIKRAILIMLRRAQRHVHVTTYGFSEISLSSYTTIIKTAWSYFTLLLNFFYDNL